MLMISLAVEFFLFRFSTVSNYKRNAHKVRIAEVKAKNFYVQQYALLAVIFTCSIILSRTYI